MKLGKACMEWLVKRVASEIDFEEMAAEEVLLEFGAEAERGDLFGELLRNERVKEHICEHLKLEMWVLFY